MVIRDKHPPPPHPKAKQPTTPSLKTMKTNYLCMPKFKAATTTSAACGRKNHRLSPMTLLDRVREAVFRLIMLSALSKAAQQSSNTGSSSSGGGDYHVHRSCYYAPHDDPHHSEAVADCIEFIKKSATTTDYYDENRDSSASSFVDAHTEPEMTIPVPFM
ncbi:hypothetical protein LOK49_LG01G02853 [Camellia lanceoleosa]|uniref:Uncharacterized protein n=1 Tax=Camellia lanceoleosa TaxID=1840588 RepID=A0ACC0J3P2_9ERIC|nr:hypothetical protein LOK49_LG01G02853 [Camellia lanceoleosa]